MLQAINMIGVDEIKGEKIGLGVGSIAGRTNVSSKDRTPRMLAIWAVTATSAC